MMDAPVDRTSVNATDGTLLILADDTDEQIVRARLTLMYMGNELAEVGGPRIGIRVKLINNYMNIMLNMLPSEATVLCESLGLNLDVVIEVTGGTAAGEEHSTTTWPGKVLEDDLPPAFVVNLVLKDLRTAVDVARKTEVPLNMGTATESYYAAASQDDKGRQDWSTLLNQVRQQAGLQFYLLTGVPMSSHFTPFTLEDISRPGNRFAMLAVNRRGAVRPMFATAGQPKPIADSVLTDFRVAVTRILSPYASAILVDKQFCFE